MGDIRNFIPSGALGGDGQLNSAPLLEVLRHLTALTERRKVARLSAGTGGVTLHNGETERVGFEFGEDGWPVRISGVSGVGEEAAGVSEAKQERPDDQSTDIAQESSPSHTLIEELMVLANHCAALKLLSTKERTVGRVHVSSDQDCAKEVRNYLEVRE